MKVILIHGNGNSTNQDHWLPYVKTELEQLGLTVVSPNFPDALKARASIWLPYLKDELMADEQTILIGHSSGAVASLRYAEKNRIYGSVIVGANYTDLGEAEEKESEYFDEPWQWEKIKANQNWIIHFASTDDPFISIEEARYIHDKLDSDYHEFTDRGHFGSPDKIIKEFPELIEALKKKLSL